MGEVIQFRPLRTSCGVTEANRTGAPGGVLLTEIEDLFFDVLWKQLHQAGQEAPPELNLPRGTLVVHRAIVCRDYRISSASEDGSQPIPENTIRSRWRRSTRRLCIDKVIGFQEPYLWWTGKPVLGKPATQQHRPGGAA